MEYSVGRIAYSVWDAENNFVSLWLIQYGYSVRRIAYSVWDATFSWRFTLCPLRLIINKPLSH